MKHFILSIFILLALVCSARTYQLEDLIEVGLKKSFSIYNEMVIRENTEDDLNLSFASLLPSLNLDADKNNNDGNWSNISARLSLSEGISSNDWRYFSIRQNLNNQKRGDISYQNVKKQIVFDVFSMYVSILQAQKNIKIQEENLTIQQSIYDQVKMQYDLGEKTLLDLQQSEISLLDYEIALNEAENNLSVLRSDLFSYLQMDDDGFLFDEPNFSENFDVKEFSENKNLQIKQLDIVNQKISLFQKKLDFFPILSASFSWGISNTYNEFSELNSFTDLKDYEDSYQLGLSLSYSIFDIIDHKIEYTKAKRNLKLQERSYEKDKRDNKIEYVNYKRDLKTLQRSQELYKEKLVLAEKNLKMAQEQYNLGLISLLDLDKITLDYSNTQLNYYKRYYDTLIKREQINVLISNDILGKW